MTKLIIRELKEALDELPADELEAPIVVHDVAGGTYYPITDLQAQNPAKLTQLNPLVIAINPHDDPMHNLG